MHRCVQGGGRGAIVAERFFDNYARPVGTPRVAERLDYGLEQAGRNSQIMGWVPGIAQGFAQSFEGRGISIVTIHVTQQFRQAMICLRVDASAVLGQACPRALEKLIA